MAGYSHNVCSVEVFPLMHCRCIHCIDFNNFKVLEVCTVQLYYLGKYKYWIGTWIRITGKNKLTGTSLISSCKLGGADGLLDSFSTCIESARVET